MNCSRKEAVRSPQPRFVPPRFVVIASVAHAAVLRAVCPG